MELQEQVTALTAEKQQYLKMIEDLNAEKLALDQMLIDALKNTLNLKKEIICKNVQINDLNTQLQQSLAANQDQERIKSLSCENVTDMCVNG